MDEIKTRLKWMGRFVDELSKEELVKIVHQLYISLENERISHKNTLDLWDLCRKNK